LETPAAFLSVVDNALDRYVARIGLYTVTAAVVAALGSAGILLGHLDTAETCIVSFIGLAFVHGVVALGTARENDVARPSKRAVIGTIAKKWPELFICQLPVFLIGSLAIAALLDSSLGSAIALVPLCIAWGAASLCDVVVAVDMPEASESLGDSIYKRLKFLLRAFTTPAGLAFRPAFIGRMGLLAIIQIPTVLLLLFIEHQSEIRHLNLNASWIAFLISCATDGLYETIFTQTLQGMREA
jgi:hypothetical protein